jgi:exo-1,4-beta-D-glucosaminidase
MCRMVLARWRGRRAMLRKAQTVGSGSGAVFEPGGYADLTGLQGLARASVRVSARTRRHGLDDVTVVRIENTSGRRTPAFLTRADVRRGDASGRPLAGDNQVLPTLWTDNDLTLWPGEVQTITARYRHSTLRGAKAVVSVEGWNLAGATFRVR